MLNTSIVHPAVMWANETTFEPIEIDCITTIMLKILDGKCKMFPEEKQVIGLLYDITKYQKGIHLGDDVHLLIERASQCENHDFVERIYELRLYAETMISRPVMKKFKAMLRENAIIGKTK